MKIWKAGKSSNFTYQDFPNNYKQSKFYNVHLILAQEDAYTLKESNAAPI